jgi:hypothetical protein
MHVTVCVVLLDDILVISADVILAYLSLYHVFTVSVVFAILPYEMY